MQKKALSYSLGRPDLNRPWVSLCGYSSGLLAYFQAEANVTRSQDGREVSGRKIDLADGAQRRSPSLCLLVRMPASARWDPFSDSSLCDAQVKEAVEKSRKMSCSLIYVNIGLLTQEVRGKRSREHLTKLKTSVKNLVQSTRPDVLCMSEVGSYHCTSKGALTEQEMEVVIKTCYDAWTEVFRCDVGWVHEWPHPYLTLYNKCTTEITKAEIIPTFVNTRKQQCCAQVLCCATHGCEPFDVWNIHNPCPPRPVSLTDKQREESLAAILSTNSKTEHGKKTAEAKVVLGGDMNITCNHMKCLLHKCSQRLWQTSANFKIYRPVNTAKNYILTPENSPDFCMANGLEAQVLEFEVDFPVEPKAHIPYGIYIQCTKTRWPKHDEYHAIVADSMLSQGHTETAQTTTCDSACDSSVLEASEAPAKRHLGRSTEMSYPRTCDGDQQPKRRW